MFILHSLFHACAALCVFYLLCVHAVFMDLFKGNIIYDTGNNTNRQVNLAISYNDRE